mmetsp:Transcript_14004/g.22688  ORF Transcript_14004/g.22688 Transcript_14004/m.22688 type:complete len:262 (+) Transcript_14004:347-1132(+)|eukprot:CAMPEP_0171501014 /NCGR_PEP_ID=MMETSP0958-20121227/9323_1 /TAXON_ID=87120 /ORGANISM="Aurantiochytrium limacinum, Strain ATCCMYA-1381" /LENGTH=261 /DNA_ID=CAMNT_0012035783 /DNA_START=260 /DNA_END=1045 /DNA_ORIENTATION=-
MAKDKKNEVVEEEEYYETGSSSDEDSDDDDSSEYEEVEEEVVTVPKRNSKKSTRALLPCDNYRVDIDAPTFGTCKCGWPKMAHESKPENKAAEALSKLHHDKTEVAPASGGPCMNFRLDVTASEFGMCKCGYRQSEHKAKADNPARRALQSLKVTAAMKPAVKADRPCDNYVADVTASEFGMCVCGWHKSEHGKKEEDAAAKMLRDLHERNKHVNESADRVALGIEDGPDAGSAAKKSSDAPTPQGVDSSTPAKKGCCIVM